VSDFRTDAVRMPIGNSDEEINEAIDILLKSMRQNLDKVTEIAANPENTLQDKIMIVLRYLFVVNNQSGNNIDGLMQLVAKKAREEEENE